MHEIKAEEEASKECRAKGKRAVIGRKAHGARGERFNKSGQELLPLLSESAL
jgi:hypothetical protein